MAIRTCRSCAYLEHGHGREKKCGAVDSYVRVRIRDTACGGWLRAGETEATRSVSYDDTRGRLIPYRDPGAEERERQERAERRARAAADYDVYA